MAPTLPLTFLLFITKQKMQKAERVVEWQQPKHTIATFKKISNHFLNIFTSSILVDIQHHNNLEK